jgi:hypothetical protein
VPDMLTRPGVLLILISALLIAFYASRLAGSATRVTTGVTAPDATTVVP